MQNLLVDLMQLEIFDATRIIKTQQAGRASRPGTPATSP
jgi:hypothetical protein